MIKMGIKINGKKFEFNSDIRLGILELMERGNTLTMKQLKIVLKELLEPDPTPKELFNIKSSMSTKIFTEFAKFIQGNSTEIKKKLST